MRSTMVPLALACAVLLGACATDPERRVVPGPLYSLRMLDAGPTDIAVTAAELPPAVRRAGDPPDGDPALQLQPLGPIGVRVYTIEVRFVRSGANPETLSAPRLTVYPNQSANISVLNQLTFIQDFDAEMVGDHVIADPIIGVLAHGLTLDLRTAAVAGTERAVDVAFRLQVADLAQPMRERTVRLAPWTSDGTIQLPRMAVNSVTGVHRLGIGQDTVVADLGDGESTTVHMRVVPNAVAREFFGDEIGSEFELADVPDFSAPELSGPGGEDVDLRRMLVTARSLGHAGGRLTLEPVSVLADLELGVALSEPSLRDRHLPQTELAVLAVLTSPTPGAEVSVQLQESFVADYDVLVSKTAYAVADPVIDTFLSGVTGTVLDDGRLRIEWTTTPAVARMEMRVFEGLTAVIDEPERQVHAVTVPLRAGRQLVPIARLPDGRTAAVWVGFVPE